MYKRLQWL